MNEINKFKYIPTEFGHITFPTSSRELKKNAELSMLLKDLTKLNVFSP